jgi:hypothetical protein
MFASHGIRSAPSGLDHLVDGKASERLTAL